MTNGTQLATGGLALACVITCALATAGDTFLWVGGESQNWFDVDNWEQGGLPASDIPGCGDAEGANVLIPPDSGTIMVDCDFGDTMTLGMLGSASPTVHFGTLILNDDSFLTDPVSGLQFALEVNENLTIEGDNSVWNGGSIGGRGLIDHDGIYEFSGSGRSLQAWFSNSGTINQKTGFEVGEWDDIGAQIFNSGTWQGGGTIARSGTKDAAFILEGGSIIAKDLESGAGTEVFRFVLPLHVQGSGTFIAENNDLRLSYGGIHQGTIQYIAENVNEIRIDRFPGSSPLEITGNARASGMGTMVLHNDLIISGSLKTEFSKNALLGFYIGSNASIGITGTGTLTNTGLMTWQDSSITSVEKVTNAAGGEVFLPLTGSGSPTIADGTELESKGKWVQFRDLTIDALSELTVTGSAGKLELHSGRIRGTGALIISQNANFEHPEDAPPGWVEVSSGLFVDGAYVWNDTGELRLTGAGEFRNASFSVDDNAVTKIRNGPYACTGLTTFVSIGSNGTYDVESDCRLEIEGRVRNFAGSLGDDGNHFRLGDSNGGEALIGTDPDSRFENHGRFLSLGGNIDLGAITELKSGQIITYGGFLNLEPGKFFTDGGITVFKTHIENRGQMHVNHPVQVRDLALLDVADGHITQTGVTLTLVDAQSYGHISNGTWELAGNNSNINGSGALTLFFGNLKKTGGGISTISCLMRAPERDDPDTQRITVESGTLRFTNWPPLAEGAPDWTIHKGAKVDIGPMNAGTKNDHHSVVTEIQGVVALGAGPLDPAEFLCDTFTNGGRIRPGGIDDTGELVLNADVVMETSSVCSINIAGTTPGDSHDLLTINGSAALDGMLRMNLLDGYVPEPGDSFVIAHADGGMSGDFAEVLGDGQWQAAVVGDDVVVNMTAAPTCPEDIGDSNGTVDVVDLLNLIVNWGFNPSHPADLNGDDLVDTVDLLAMLIAWGPCDG